MPACFSGKHPYEYLNDHLRSMAKERGSPLATLTTDLHMWPDFHGNRSPLNDPTLRGMVSFLDGFNFKNLVISHPPFVEMLYLL